jgi:hypothetical protein
MKKILAHTASALILGLPLLVSAQNIGLQNPVKVNSIAELILIVTRVARYIAIPFIVLAIMYSGFQFIAAQAGLTGYSLPKAKESLWYTVIGAFILLSAELIALVMKNTIEGLTN